MTADTLTAPESRAPRRARARRWRAWAVIVLALGVAGFLAARTIPSAADVRSGTEAVTPQEFAAHTGITVSLVGVTAAGGMIEFRYRVLDPDKASLLVHQEDRRPIIVVEDTGATLVLSSRPHNNKAELNLGGTYFFLFPNANNAVHDGTKVTIVIGDVRLEHVVARS